MPVEPVERLSATIEPLGLDLALYLQAAEESPMNEEKLSGKSRVFIVCFYSF